MKIFVSFLSAAVFLSPKVVSGIVRVGLRRVWVSSAAVYIAEYFEDILGKVSVSGLKYLVSETLYLAVLGMHDVRQR